MRKWRKCTTLSQKKKKNQQYFVWHFPQLSSRNCAPAWLGNDSWHTNRHLWQEQVPTPYSGLHINYSHKFTHSSYLQRLLGFSPLVCLTLTLLIFVPHLSQNAISQGHRDWGRYVRTHAHAHTCLHTARVQRTGAGELWKRWISMGWKIWQGDQGKRR